MRIVLSGGGTAGHINPAIALAEELSNRGHDIYFAGTPDGIEAQLVQDAGYPYQGFESKGFNRAKISTLIKSSRTVMRSTAEAIQWYLKIRPYGVVAFGGYVCLPLARAAKSLNAPLIIHEQNSVMGVANKYLARQAQAVALTYQEAAKDVKNQDIITITGNPVRHSFFTATREEGRELLGIPDDACMILVFGGSQGARHINEAMIALKEELLDFPNLYIVHVTGPKEYDSVLQSLHLSDEEAKRWIVMDYQNQMAETMAAADIIVARSGASSLAEISALKIPALLIPYPHATADHQTLNAQAYVDRGAAYMVEDQKLDSDLFKLRLFTLIIDKDVRESMREAAATFNTENAAANLADLVIDTIKRCHLSLPEDDLDDNDENKENENLETDQDVDTLDDNENNQETNEKISEE